MPLLDICWRGCPCFHACLCVWQGSPSVKSWCLDFFQPFQPMWKIVELQYLVYIVVVTDRPLLKIVVMFVSLCIQIKIKLGLLSHKEVNFSFPSLQCLCWLLPLACYYAHPKNAQVGLAWINLLTEWRTTSTYVGAGALDCFGFYNNLLKNVLL